MQDIVNFDTVLS